MNDQCQGPTVLVTGATSGIGNATCRTLAERGFALHAVARRRERLETLADHEGVAAHPTDLSDEAAVDRLADAVGALDAVVHCAGGARGRAPVLESDTEQWRWMWETNVLGTMYLLRRVAPRLVDQGHGAIVVVTSVAAFECPDGSTGYSASKHAQSTIVQTLRNELLGTGVRVTEIAPGLVDTEFFDQRFPDDPDTASSIFAGLTPLAPSDVADVIAFVLEQPPHVNIDRIVLRPTAQGSHGRFHRS